MMNANTGIRETASQDMNNYRIVVNGQNVHVWQYSYGWAVEVNHTFWGVFETEMIALQAAVMVIEGAEE